MVWKVLLVIAVILVIVLVALYYFGRSGRADVMFSSAPLPAFEVLRNPDKLYQPSTDAFYRQPVGMVIRKGDPDSLNVLDNWIRTVEAEGWLPERRHFWFKTTDWEAQLR